MGDKPNKLKKVGHITVYSTDELEDAKEEVGVQFLGMEVKMSV